VAHTGGREGDDAVVIPLTEDCFDQGGFARAVGADQGHHLAAMDVQIHIPKDLIAADADGKILNTQAAGISAGTAVV
jgi:hypothetical protein